MSEQKEIGIYWYALIVALFAIALGFRINYEETQLQLEAKMRELKQRKIAKDQYIKHKDYLTLHSEELGFINQDEFKASLKAIARISGINELNVSNITEKGHIREFTVEMQAPEKNCYNFIYYCERIMNGVLDIRKLQLKAITADRMVQMKMQGKITYFDLKFPHNELVTHDVKEYAKAAKKDCQKHCSMRLFAPGVEYKLNGIVGEKAIINGKIYKIGDTVGDDTISKIYKTSIDVESTAEGSRKISLGGSI